MAEGNAGHFLSIGSHSISNKERQVINLIWWDPVPDQMQGECMKTGHSISKIWVSKIPNGLQKHIVFSDISEYN